MKRFQALTPMQKIIFLVLCVLIALPCVLGAFLLIYNPNYYLKLVEPGALQPAGWIVFLAGIFLLGLLIFVSWKVVTVFAEDKKLLWILLIIVFIVLDAAFLMFVMFAPVVLILLASPVGRMFFGAG